MKLLYLGRSPSRLPLYIEAERVYSEAVYRKLAASLSPKGRASVYTKVFKRFFDIVISGFLLVLLLPLFLVLALCVRLSSRGPVFFKQERIGRYGKPFICYKFRTMTTEAPSDLPSDSFFDRKRYVTAVGRFLRRTSLDELPQLFSVFTGKMSLVGYRPLIAKERDCHAMREKLLVYRQRPGMTGYAQLSGRDFVQAKNKALLDAYYVKNASFAFDLMLLFKTLFLAFFGKDNRDAE